MSKLSLFFRIAGISVLLFAVQANAGPMGFKDSWMGMGDFSPNWREAFINYAITPRDAFGISGTYMRSDDETKTRDLAELTSTRLVKRWNMRDAQANLWFSGGIGTLSGNDFDGSKTMVSPGLQFDYETTRIYFAVAEKLYRAKDINHDYSSVRAGFSFYETHYDQTQPWFILEARRMNGLSDKTEITPMLRLINPNYFVEAGVNNSSQLRFNFMYIF
ncbi:MAG TPA: hypothetical protein VK974_03120 [Methylophilaceae bacterium]|nr:hypothetical protein [Methylophilaceae bacterium]